MNDFCNEIRILDPALILLCENVVIGYLDILVQMPDIN